MATNDGQPFSPMRKTRLMIQRIQTIYLFLAAVSALCTLAFPFALTGLGLDFSVIFADGVFNWADHLAIPIIFSLAALLAFGAIFLFRNRKLQRRVGAMVVLLGLAGLGWIGALYFQAHAANLSIPLATTGRTVMDLPGFEQTGVLFKRTLTIPVNLPDKDTSTLSRVDTSISFDSTRPDTLRPDTALTDSLQLDSSLAPPADTSFASSAPASTKDTIVLDSTPLLFPAITPVDSTAMGFAALPEDTTEVLQPPFTTVVAVIPRREHIDSLTLYPRTDQTVGRVLAQRALPHRDTLTAYHPPVAARLAGQRREAAPVSLQLGLIFPVLMLVFVVLARRNIQKDEKLVRSMDRLR